MGQLPQGSRGPPLAHQPILANRRIPTRSKASPPHLSQLYKALSFSFISFTLLSRALLIFPLLLPLSLSLSSTQWASIIHARLRIFARHTSTVLGQAYDSGEWDSGHASVLDVSVLHLLHEPTGHLGKCTILSPLDLLPLDGRNNSMSRDIFPFAPFRCPECHPLASLHPHRTTGRYHQISPYPLFLPISPIYSALPRYTIVTSSLLITRAVAGFPCSPFTIGSLVVPNISSNPGDWARVPESAFDSGTLDI